MAKALYCILSPKPKGRRESYINKQANKQTPLQANKTNTKHGVVNICWCLNYIVFYPFAHYWTTVHENHAFFHLQQRMLFHYNLISVDIVFKVLIACQV